MAARDAILATLLAQEIEAHGAVRPPWIAFPNVHPFDIAWRMGAGETHVMLWSMYADGLEPRAIAATIRRYGPVPADWAWWAAEATAVIEVEGEGDIYDVPFPAVRDKLATAGIVVDGSPLED